jgi:hypothetical protein
MLTDDVGRRAYLKIVLLVITGDKIRVIEGDAVVRIRAEEQRLRWFSARLGRSDVGPQRENARLREVPACLIQF